MEKVAKVEVEVGCREFENEESKITAGAGNEFIAATEIEVKLVEDEEERGTVGDDEKAGENEVAVEKLCMPR